MITHVLNADVCICLQEKTCELPKPESLSAITREVKALWDNFLASEATGTPTTSHLQAKLAAHQVNQQLAQADAAIACTELANAAMEDEPVAAAVQPLSSAVAVTPSKPASVTLSAVSPAAHSQLQQKPWTPLTAATSSSSSSSSSSAASASQATPSAAPAPITANPTPSAAVAPAAAAPAPMDVQAPSSREDTKEILNTLFRNAEAEQAAADAASAAAAASASMVYSEPAPAAAASSKVPQLSSVVQTPAKSTFGAASRTPIQSSAQLTRQLQAIKEKVSPVALIIFSL
jgi:hypothetical protein